MEKKLLHQILYRAGKNLGNQKAVVFKDSAISYSELHRKSTLLANTILLKAPREEFIAISTTRGIEMIIGVLAILKSGKAYLPIDPNYPVERHKNMVEISSVSYIIAGPSEDESWAPLGLKRIPYNEESEIESEIEFSSDLYALFFTSGSTGKPKGVMVKHEGAVNLVEHKLKHSKAAGAGVKTLQFCHLGFDVSVEEIFVCLSSGGELHLVDDIQRLDAYYLLNYIKDHQINNVFFPFVALQYFTDAAVSSGIFPQSLTEVNTGGELLKITPQIRAFFRNVPGAYLKNNYGPTEASIWVSDLDLKGDPDNWEEIPSIGQPFPNCEFWILDEQLNPVQKGDLGELHISGSCLAKGYMNRDDLTAARFIDWKSPDGETIKLYKTGDLVNRNEAGYFYFNGREDDQIKIRGNRVELGEIECALSNLPNIKHAIVKLDEDHLGQKFLCGYLQFDKKNKIEIIHIKAELKKFVPEYMIPDFLVEVDEFPRTSSGKVDKKALPKPLHARPQTAAQLAPPTTETEKNILGLFQETLNYDKISIYDNFFELGGNSLKGQKTIAELKQRFGYELPIIKLYQFPTVAQIADYLKIDAKPKVFANSKKDINKDGKDVAVIGMAFKFPGADTEEQLLEILRMGKETIRFFDQNELDKSISEEHTGIQDMFVLEESLVDMINLMLLFLDLIQN